MKTSILEDWNFVDLYEKNFWERVIPQNQMPFPPGLPFFFPPQPGLSNEFIVPIVEYWEPLPKKIQSIFLDSREIFDFWMDIISESEYYVFTEIIKNKLWRNFEQLLKDNQNLKNLLKDSTVLDELTSNKKSQKFGRFDSLFVEFLEKSKEVDAILLNTEDLVFLGGNDKEKISETIKLMIGKNLNIVEELTYKATTGKKKKTVFLVVMTFNENS